MRCVVTGRPGSGKTTYVEQRRKPGDLVWDHDAVTQCLFRSDDLDESCLFIVRRVLDELLMNVRRYRFAGDVWVIITNQTWARDIARQIGAQVVVIDTEADECVRRIAERDEEPRRSEKMRIAREWV